MDKIEKLKKEKQYEKYVKQKTPAHNVWLNMLKAFLLGGLICTVGQIIFHYCEAQGLDQDACSAGALVPITGFANSVAAPAIEYKKEGQVFGIGCKIFTIAGPVILYGIFTSWGLGVIYWIGTLVE